MAVKTLTANLAMPDPNREYYVNGRGYRAAQWGPYAFPVRIRTRAYAVHTGGGDSSKASLKLVYNGQPAGEAKDQRFGRADLQVLQHTVLDKGQTAAFAIESGNSGATEAYYGFEFWFTLA
ncbi:MAG TPA: hypothetical protein VFP12_05720 [Allosphingosinicella sp.]|nr:hypothetical protein [Allosphingosinicella sp.]